MELRFDFAADDTSAGFRLEYFELYNWGTYNNTIAKLSLDKSNGLLTGDIGSGKSTIVDALTTLIVPHQKIIYNKAAGANTKERSLHSYIIGEYKSSQDENFGNSKAISLRDEKNFTVILGRFQNEGYDESLTLAQFFYIANNQVNKFFVVCSSDFSIKEDFFNFSDIRELKKRLRAKNHTNVYDTFKDYSKEFMRTMGIKNEQALNLFYQTVSLKSIGNLTEFIRSHMLESNDIQKDIDQLCSNFADLNHTHELVLKAKKQIELLEPINSEAKRYKQLENEQIEKNSIQDGLNLYFASIKVELLSTKIDELTIELTKNSSNKTIISQELESISDDIIKLKIELERNGGDRLNQIQNEIKQTTLSLSSTKEQNETFNLLVKSLDMVAVSNEHRFLKTIEEVQERYESIESKITSIENNLMRDNNSVINYKKEHEELEVEIIYLQNHPSNIPHRISKIRDTMCDSLGLQRDDLPFVGELISTSDDKWAGAIERVLHNFALSLVVSSELYEMVSNYVENTHLQGKLIYLKVDYKKQNYTQSSSVPNSLLDKIELKSDSIFYDWLYNELYSRFDISCVENLEEFRRYKKALSINGQFKSNLSRHEKDDRFDIDDKSRWVLGWDNILKLEAIQKEAKKLEEKVQYLQNSISQNENEKKQINTQRDTLRDALKYKSFSTIDWYRHSITIEKLENEKNELLKSTDIIKTLQVKIDELIIEQKVKKQKEENLINELGRISLSIENKQEELNSSKLLLDNNILQEDIKQKINTLIEELIDANLNLNTINQSQKKLKESLDKSLRSLGEKKERSVTKLITNMSNFIKEYPVISKEFDASISSLDEFKNKLITLKKDNLPKWEKKFKELFKEKTIQGIVLLQSKLEKDAKDIVDKIAKINLSLNDIEYSTGTYIELIAQKSNIADIKEFQQKLKSVTSGSIGYDNSYDEEKFLQIKDIISRFNGRESYIDIDKKWKKTVIDVRNWFDFSASEKYLSDGTQKEFYAHSGGKSGGQKEKLAYTVLASSLAYQFGLEHEKIQSRSFRFVMIDEAFGRGSDESTRYALKLFESLKLQLLVITPKQKINVIEPFVKSVHFVHNQDGMDSSLISMRIEEYQKNKNV
jgi:uncharacterized protein YPO0396